MKLLRNVSRSLILTAAAAALASGPSRALAIPPFMKEFTAKYVKADAADEKDKAFAEKVTKTAKCNVCHVGMDKKVRNAYGKQVAMLLKKDNFKAERLQAEADKAKEEIVAALDAVAALKSGDGDAPTFGELIAQGKLPGGEAAAEPANPAPPNPSPAPSAPAPAAAGAAALSPEAKEAVAKIQKIGGTVQPLAMNDDSLVVDFHLGGTALNDEGLAAVKLLPKVVQLDLKDTQITDAGLANLAALGTLSKLHLEKTKVTDAGLVHLKGLGNLEYLNLYGTAVTDAGLEHLKELKNLKKLYLWQSQVTDGGVDQLKQALPGVTVVK